MKCPIINFCHAFIDLQLVQAVTVVGSSVSYPIDAMGDVHVGQTGTTGEGMMADLYDAIRDEKMGQTGAAFKDTRTNFCDIVKPIDLCQTAAVHKSAELHGTETVRQINIFQVAAPCKELCASSANTAMNYSFGEPTVGKGQYVDFGNLGGTAICFKLAQCRNASAPMCFRF